MGSARIRSWLPFAGVIALLVSTTARADLPFERTEELPFEKCGDFEPLRKPLFGDLHVHTWFSADAYVFDVFSGPRDAYDFARGAEIGLPPYDGGPPSEGGVPTRRIRLRRPLDFAAVTDHSEGFGYMNACFTPGTLGYESVECRVIRGEVISGRVPGGATAKLFFLLPTVIFDPPLQYPMCQFPDTDCAVASSPMWSAIQEAAEEAYQPCSFTTFKGYEYTPTPYFNNMHRNVIFRNGNVPRVPTSYYETSDSDPTLLFDALERHCLHADFGDGGCDVLSIPHNSNLSGGMMFPDPENPEEARQRAELEPLAEIFQHKASSECRFDRVFGAGVDTNDELCAFEQSVSLNLSFFAPAPPPQAFPRRAFLRNVLKDGLVLAKRFDGTNPYKLGLVSSTDTHNASPGFTSERDFEGHAGLNDETSGKRVGLQSLFQWNPGGHAVVWAEENTRDAIFAALRRRETYGTSGTRPIVRFFGGWGYTGDLCDASDRIEGGYAGGVPMGGDLPPRPEGAGAPRFLVSALKDAGTPELAGTPLQRIQIVKGWVDAQGETRELVHDVAGDAGNGASVDPETCEPVGPGADGLCTVWQDPDFDPDEPAFYYARILENPSCRWSTFQCKARGVDPFAPDCLAQAAEALPGLPMNLCCTEPPVIQERAWTSPVWYTPEAG